MSVEAAKRVWRARMRGVRAAIPAAERERRGQQGAAFAAELVEAGCVCAYAATGPEAPTGPLLEALHDAAARVYLPRVTGDGMVMRHAERGGDLRPGRFGIPEPPADAEPLPPGGERLAVVVPGLAFDRRDRTRLGMGGGFYDRWTAGLRDAGGWVHIELIGLAFREQVLGGVPRDAHDLRVDRLWEI